MDNDMINMAMCDGKGVCGTKRLDFKHHWIGSRDNLNRKPWILPWNIGRSCKFSHHPILWINIWDNDMTNIRLTSVALRDLLYGNALQVFGWWCFSLCSSMLKLRHVVWKGSLPLEIHFMVNYCFNLWTCLNPQMLSWTIQNSLSLSKYFTEIYQHLPQHIFPKMQINKRIPYLPQNSLLAEAEKYGFCGFVWKY